jgi:hypothetical protein
MREHDVMGREFKPIIHRIVEQPPKLASPDLSTDLHYRALIVGPDGEVVRAHGFFAEDDDAAMRHARQFAALHTIYLWNGRRLVAKLKAIKAVH